MRVSISTLQRGDKFLYPILADGEPLNNEPCVIIGNLDNFADFVVIKTGQRGTFPLQTIVAKCEGFKTYHDKRLT